MKKWLSFQPSSSGLPANSIYHVLLCVLVLCGNVSSQSSSKVSLAHTSGTPSTSSQCTYMRIHVEAGVQLWEVESLLPPHGSSELSSSHRLEGQCLCPQSQFNSFPLVLNTMPFIIYIKSSTICESTNPEKGSIPNEEAGTPSFTDFDFTDFTDLSLLN